MNTAGYPRSSTVSTVASLTTRVIELIQSGRIPLLGVPNDNLDPTSASRQICLNQHFPLGSRRGSDSSLRELRWSVNSAILPRHGRSDYILSVSVHHRHVVYTQGSPCQGGRLVCWQSIRWHALRSHYLRIGSYRASTQAVAVDVHCSRGRYVPVGICSALQVCIMYQNGLLLKIESPDSK